METWLVVLIAIIVYAVTCAVLGIVAERSTRREGSTLAEYFLAGRSIGPAVAVLAMMSTILSSFALLGMPGYFYTHGLGSWHMIFANLAFPFLFWLYAFRMFYLGRKYGYITLGDFMEHRFNRTMRIISAICLIVTTVPYIAIQIQGFGNIVEGVTLGNVPWLVGALGLGVIMVWYIFLGGYRGVAWTDAMQGVVMTVALLLGALTMARKLFGGVPQMFEAFARQHPERLTVPGPQGYWNLNMWISWLFFIMGMCSQPQIVQKFFSVRDERSVRLSMVAHPALTWLIYTGAMLIGFVGVLAFPGLTPLQADSVSMMAVSKYAPPLVAGVVAVGAVAAAMSTADAQYLTLSSMFVRDIYDRGICALKGKKADERLMVVLGRWFSVVLLIIGFAIAYARLTTLVNMITLTVYPLGTQVFIPMLFGLYWRRANSQGVIAGTVSGFLTALLTLFVIRSPLGIHPLFWGGLVNVAVTVVVTLLTPPPSPEVVAQIRDYADSQVYTAGD